MTKNIREPLLAGAAKVDITPQDLAGLTNLGQTPFEGVHDQIFLRSLVVDNGANTAAIFETVSGEPIAILMNYAVHPVVLGPENSLVTGDLAGAAE